MRTMDVDVFGSWAARPDMMYLYVFMLIRATMM